MSESPIGFKLRKQMLQKLKIQVQLYLGQESSSLRRYALPYKKDIERSKWTKSSNTEMLDTLKGCDIVLGGDFHAFSQAQRSHLRVLRSLSETRKIILALECIPSSKQRTLDAYMSGKLSDKDFLQKVGWFTHWGFPWEQYKPLFEYIKSVGGKCIAVNQIPKSQSYKSLVARDKHAADVVAKVYKKKKSDELIYVMFGDLHIARNHLQKQLKKRLPKTKVATVFLNPEKLYFQFYKKNQDHQSSIVKFSAREFCLLESPPWVKWQSYLIYLNQNYDQFIDDDDSVDYSEHVQSLVHIICADFDISFPEPLTVYSFHNLDFLDILEERLSAELFKNIQLCVSNDLSFYLPKQKKAFLARATVNYSAHLAGLIVHAHVSAKKEWITVQDSHFEIMIWREAVAFFLSKVINPKRKAIRLDDLKKQLAAFSPQDKGEEALKLALDQKMSDLLLVYGAEETKGKKRVVKESISYLRAAKILGAMLGEKLFNGYRAGHLSKVEIKNLLEFPLESKDFYNFYIQTLKRVDKIDLEPQ